ncbi:MAG: hypothetical protein Pg6C_12500 [Treponemataceae bacterium]|nr:MAG: hypothetical protein Pg6C_12500 [Treponemataceae bacterium]
MKKRATVAVLLAVFACIYLFGQSASDWFAKGHTFLERDDYDMAIECFTEGIKLNPTADAAHYYRGNAYLQKEDYDRAIAGLHPGGKTRSQIF